LSGFSDLPSSARRAVATHAADRANWARRTVRRQSPKGLLERHWVPPGADPGATALDASVVPAVRDGRQLRESARLKAMQPRFAAPTPRSSSEARRLAGHTVILTGTFPELGGGSGLALGKANARALVEGFGGTVRSKVSGRTTLVVVGKNPGKTTIDEARRREAAGSRLKLVTLPALSRGLKRGDGVFEGDGVEGAVEGSSQSSSSSCGSIVKRLEIPHFSQGFVTIRNKKAGGLGARKSAAMKKKKKVAEEASPDKKMTKRPRNA